MTNKLTIVVNTCDAYNDVLSLFFAAFKEYWQDCPYDIVINSELLEYSEYPAKTNNYNGREWGGRLLSTLNGIKTEYILMLYDDFILEDFVSNEKIKKICDLLDKDDNSAVVYLIDTKSQGCLLSGLNLTLLDNNIDYRLNSAPAIWRRTDLIRYTGLYDNPWAWEVFGSYRTYKENKNFYSISSKNDDIYPYNYNKGGAIYRGKWVEEIVKDKVNKYQLPLDLSERGFSSDLEPEKRSLSWKVNFMKIGFKMVGFKAFIFIYRYVKAKIL